SASPRRPSMAACFPGIPVRGTSLPALPGTASCRLGGRPKGRLYLGRRASDHVADRRSKRHYLAPGCAYPKIPRRAPSVPTALTFSCRCALTSPCLFHFLFPGFLLRLRLGNLNLEKSRLRPPAALSPKRGGNARRGLICRSPCPLCVKSSANQGVSIATMIVIYSAVPR